MQFAKKDIFESITPEWISLMKIAKAVKFAKMEIIFKNGKPIHINNTTQQIKLDDPNGLPKNLKILTIQ